MAVASGPAGPVLAGPVLTFGFQTAHAQTINDHVKIFRSPAHMQFSKILDYLKYRLRNFDFRTLRLGPCVYRRSGLSSSSFGKHPVLRNLCLYNSLALWFLSVVS